MGKMYIADVGMIQDNVILPTLSYFSFQPVLHDWFNKGRGMCYPVCGFGVYKRTIAVNRKE